MDKLKSFLRTLSDTELNEVNEASRLTDIVKREVIFRLQAPADVRTRLPEGRFGTLTKSLCSFRIRHYRNDGRNGKLVSIRSIPQLRKRLTGSRYGGSKQLL